MVIQYVLILVIISIPAIAQGLISYRYKKYSDEANSCNLSGFEVARKILDANGLSKMDIVATQGTLTDHYDPRRKVVRLSQTNFDDCSVAAMAVAAHECGHAIQDKEGYFMLKLRSFIYPIVNIATKLSYIIIVIGLILSFLNLIYAGIACTALGLVFQLITLPVEFNASRRAGIQLQKLGLSSKTDSQGVKKVLTAAAMTYVAGVLASLLQVLRLVLLFTGRRD